MKLIDTAKAREADEVAPLAGAGIEIRPGRPADGLRAASPLSQGRELKCINYSLNVLKRDVAPLAGAGIEIYCAKVTDTPS